MPTTPAVKHHPTFHADREPEEVGKRIALVVDILGLTQAEVAARITKILPPGDKPMRQGTVSGWISGGKPMGLEKAQLFCDAYGVTLDWLYRGDTGTLPMTWLLAISKPSPDP